MNLYAIKFYSPSNATEKIVYFSPLNLYKDRSIQFYVVVKWNDINYGIEQKEERRKKGERLNIPPRAEPLWYLIIEAKGNYTFT